MGVYTMGGRIGHKFIITIEIIMILMTILLFIHIGSDVLMDCEANSKSDVVYKVDNIDELNAMVIVSKAINNTSGIKRIIPYIINGNQEVLVHQNNSIFRVSHNTSFGDVTWNRSSKNDEISVGKEDNLELIKLDIDGDGLDDIGYLSEVNSRCGNVIRFGILQGSSFVGMPTLTIIKDNNSSKYIMDDSKTIDKLLDNKCNKEEADKITNNMLAYVMKTVEITKDR